MGEKFASEKSRILQFSRIFIVEDQKSLAVEKIYFKRNYRKMSAPFYKKPAPAKSGFDWPPKRVERPVKVSRQEPEPEQERIDLAIVSTTN